MLNKYLTSTFIAEIASISFIRMEVKMDPQDRVTKSSNMKDRLNAAGLPAL